MKTSPSRILGFTLSAAMAVGGLLVTVPANADPEDAAPDVASVPAPAVTADDSGDALVVDQDTPAVTPEAVTATPDDGVASAATTTPSITTGPDTNVRVGTDGDPSDASLIPDANLRQCIADAMRYQATGYSPGSPEYQSQVQATTQADLDALASASTYNYALSCTGVSSLAGLENLHDPQLTGLYATDGQIEDLSPIAGLTSLRYLTLHDNNVSDIAPLQGLTNLWILDLSNNQISDVAPLAGLASLYTLDLSNNKISNTAPLSGLTQLSKLYLHNNKITSIAPLAAMLNSSTQNQCTTSIYNCFKLYWTLSGNQITDVSSLDWNALGKAWLTVPSEYQRGIYNYSVNGQSVTQAGTVGATVSLPYVAQAKNDPYPLTWSVVSGNATINKDTGKVTYNSVGPVLLRWADNFTADCPTNTWFVPTCSPGDASSVNLSFFSGTVSVNVTEAGAAAPAPSVPDSLAVKQAVTASTTGGAARLADGADSYTLITTVRSANGQLLTGYASELTPIAPSGVSVSLFSDNGNGTYSATVTSATPGNYKVQVMLGDTVISDIPVNFIGAQIEAATVMVGDIEYATGLGFLPGEMVTVTVHPDPITLGVVQADAQGKVFASFTLPKDFAIGRHTVEFAGDISGTTSIGFDAIANPLYKTGGTAAPASSAIPALVLAFSLAAAAAFSLTMGLKKRSR